jgi:hypothetical protein
MIILFYFIALKYESKEAINQDFNLIWSVRHTNFKPPQNCFLNLHPKIALIFFLANVNLVSTCFSNQNLSSELDLARNSILVAALNETLDQKLM